MKEEIMKDYDNPFADPNIPEHNKKRWANTFYENEVLQKWNNVKYQSN